LYWPIFESKTIQNVTVTTLTHAAEMMLHADNSDCTTTFL